MKLGKTPARPNSVSFRLRDYVAVHALPTPPRRAGRQSLIKTWQMLGNDRYGDCVWAGAAHETMLWNAEAKTDVPFTYEAVLSDYSAVTGFNPHRPKTDQGTDMQVAASYRRKTGVVDAKDTRHKVAAYLAITPGNREEIRQAVYLFGAIGIGIEFPTSAGDQFTAGKPWTVVPGSPIDGGHYIPAVGYDGTYVYVVTWAKLQKVAWSFLDKYMDEGIAYVSTEMLVGGKSPEGFNAKQLKADLQKLK